MMAFTTQRVVIEVPEHALGCQKPKTFKKCSHKKTHRNWPLQKIPQHTTMFFVCHPKILHKHCFSVSLGAIVTPKRNWRQCFYKMSGWQTKSIMVCYGIFCSGQYPWRGEEIKDSRDVKGLANQCAVLWCGRGVCELSRLASLYVRKEQETNNEPQNCIKWWWIEPRLHRKSNNRLKFT